MYMNISNLHVFFFRLLKKMDFCFTQKMFCSTLTCKVSIFEFVIYLLCTLENQEGQLWSEMVPPYDTILCKEKPLQVVNITYLLLWFITIVLTT